MPTPPITAAMRYDLVLTGDARMMRISHSRHR